jgi:MoaA/NifB/PqqE/SkfB family radical SAM enzyme
VNFRKHALDNAALLFDRDRGLNILLPGQSERRQAPRVLQIGLLTPCNLTCSFCYRDQSAPSRLTADFLLNLLSEAAQWGVLEVAFGGGEPLLFRGFPELVRRLHDTTPLGINFTTNGTLLTPDVLAQLSGAVSEIRVSAYPDNHYRRTLD